MDNFNFLMDIFSELLGSHPIEEHRPFDVSVKKEKKRKTKRGRPQEGFHGRGWAREGKARKSHGAGKKRWEEREDRGEKSEVIDALLIQFSLCFQTRG
jgi:hypothetical protein